MSWLTLTVDTDAQHAEALSEALLELGALSVDLLDADAGTPDEQAIFGRTRRSAARRCGSTTASAPCSTTTGMYPQSCTKPPAASASNNFRTPHRNAGRQRLGAPHQSQSNRSGFRRGCGSCPTWHTPSDPDAINIVLDPGLAFGTGSHPTTRLCLRWLDDTSRAANRCWTTACGSGILAIAALKLGLHAPSALM